MKKNFIFMLCFFLAGCVSTLEQQAVDINSMQKKPLTNMDLIKVGMTIEEVTKLMGEQMPIGYQHIDSSQNSLDPVVLKNPYKIEILKASRKIYHVIYYFTSVEEADGVIADDELTPLIFENESEADTPVLVGKGWDFLFKLKKSLNLS